LLSHIGNLASTIDFEAGKNGLRIVADARRVLWVILCKNGLTECDVDVDPKGKIVTCAQCCMFLMIQEAAR
jgi:hypothetical protein